MTKKGYRHLFSRFVVVVVVLFCFVFFNGLIITSSSLTRSNLALTVL